MSIIANIIGLLNKGLLYAKHILGYVLPWALGIKRWWAAYISAFVDHILAKLQKIQHTLNQ